MEVKFQSLICGFFVYFQRAVEYSKVPKAPKICQMTFNKHFDEKIITIRCVVLEISYFEKSLEIEVITPFTAIGRNMTNVNSVLKTF